MNFEKQMGKCEPQFLGELPKPSITQRNENYQNCLGWHSQGCYLLGAILPWSLFLLWSLFHACSLCLEPTPIWKPIPWCLGWSLLEPAPCLQPLLGAYSYLEAYSLVPWLEPVLEPAAWLQFLWSLVAIFLVSLLE